MMVRTRIYLPIILLQMCNAQLAPHVSWNVTNSLYGSDDFPTLIKVGIYLNQNKYKPFPKYKLDSVNWDKFQMNCTEQNRKCNYSRNITYYRILFVSNKTNLLNSNYLQQLSMNS